MCPKLQVDMMCVWLSNLLFGVVGYSGDGTKLLNTLGMFMCGNIQRHFISLCDFIFHGQWELETSLFVDSVSIVWCSKRFRSEMWFSASCRSADKNGFLPLGFES